MYSSPKIPVDKGLGFDFSAITDFVKSAGTTALNVYQGQQQIKLAKAQAQVPPPPLMMPGQPGYMPPSGMFGSGMSTMTMLAIGGLAIGGVVLLRNMMK